MSTDTDDFDLDELAEETLAGHRDHCVAHAVGAAIDHGIDDPFALRQVASQLLDDRAVRCVCQQPPDPNLVGHNECANRMAEAIHTVSGYTATLTLAHPPAGPDDESIWDCAHGVVYRIRRCEVTA